MAGQLKGTAVFGRAATAANRVETTEVFRSYADVPAAGPRALSKHALSCALITLFGYKPTTVSVPCRGAALTGPGTT
jgi:hypothetical protein